MARKQKAIARLFIKQWRYVFEICSIELRRLIADKSCAEFRFSVCFWIAASNFADSWLRLG